MTQWKINNVKAFVPGTWSRDKPWDAELCLQQVPLVAQVEKKKTTSEGSRCGSAVTSLTSIHEDEGSIPGLAQWVKDLALP